MCQFSVFRILELVFVPLKDPNQYILVPETPLELSVLCGTRLETIMQDPSHGKRSSSNVRSTILRKNVPIPRLASNVLFPD